MNEFKEQGKTIFFISHSLSQVKSFCTKALWLHYGQVKEYGDIKEIVDHYDEFLKKYNQMSVEERKDLRKEQISQFQHGLLQEDQTGRERKRKKGKKTSRKFKKKRVLITGVCIALLTGIISTGYYYKNLLPFNSENKYAEKVASKENVTESKQMVKKEKGAAKYIVNSNGISIREEADASSKRLAIANFGDIFTISDSNKK